jgi:hypothetical protein
MTDRIGQIWDNQRDTFLIMYTVEKMIIDDCYLIHTCVSLTTGVQDLCLFEMHQVNRWENTKHCTRIC